MSSAAEAPPARPALPPLTAAGMALRAGLVGLIYLMWLDLGYLLAPKIADVLRTLRLPLSPAARLLIDSDRFLHQYLGFSLPVLIAIGGLHAWAICQPGRIRIFARWLAVALVLLFALLTTSIFTGLALGLKANPTH